MAALAAALFAAASPAQADDPSWPTSLNSNAQQISDNYLDYTMTFPVAGPVDGLTGETPALGAADGFCYNRAPRNYSTQRCISPPQAHKGQDFVPLIANSVNGAPGWRFTSMGLTPVVSPTSGTVTQSRCSGAGYVFEVKGAYDIRFSFWHLHAMPMLPVNASVAEGRRAAFVGGSGGGNSCSQVQYSPPHVHIEMTIPTAGANCLASTNPCHVDPWVSLRTAYARPGLFASGQVNTSMRDIWVWHAYWNGIENVGYPIWTEFFGGANVQYQGSGWNIAEVQYLSNGLSTFDSYYRTGALVQVLGQPGAVWTYNGWFRKWVEMGQATSYLGFPIADVVGNRQNFQGGCIAVSGSAAYAAPYGSWPCN